MNTERISLVMAVRNEKGGLAKLFRELDELKGYSLEFIFVEGGSIDGTYEELLRLQGAPSSYTIKVLKQDGKGKKDAIVKGIKNATGEFLFVYDPDGEIAVRELPKFFEALAANKKLFLNSTRFKLPMEKHMHWLNRAGNKIFAVLMSAMTGRWLTDPLCGLKGARTKHYRAMIAAGCFDNDLDWFAEFDQLFGAKRLGLTIKELPVVYHNRRYGETKVRRFKVGRQLLKRIFWEVGRPPRIEEPGVPNRTRKKLLIGVLGATLLLMLIHITGGFFDHASVRSVETFTIAKNFITQHLSILHPRVDWGGPNGGYEKFEFQLYTYALALLMRIFGIVPVVGRLFTIFITLLTGIFLYKLLRTRFSEKAAIFGAAVYLLNPIVVYFGRSIQPDPLMMFFGVLGVWIVAREERPGVVSGIFGSLCMILAMLLKPTAGVFLAPFLVLLFGIESWHDLWKKLLSWRIALYAALVAAIAAPAAAYYSYINRVADMSILNSRAWWISPGAVKALFTNHLYQKYAGAAFVAFHPIGWILLILGIILPFTKKDFFVHTASVAAAAFGVVMFPQWLEFFHEWHFMLGIFPMALAGAKVFDGLYQLPPRKWLAPAYTLLAIPGIFILFFTTNTNPATIYHNVEVINAHTPQDAVVAVTDPGSTVTNFYSGRIAVDFVFAVSLDAIRDVEARGATFLEITRPNSLAPEEQSVLAQYPLVYADDAVSLYQLVVQ